MHGCMFSVSFTANIFLVTQRSCDGENIGWRSVGRDQVGRSSDGGDRCTAAG